MTDQPTPEEIEVCRWCGNTPLGTLCRERRGVDDRVRIAGPCVATDRPFPKEPSTPQQRWEWGGSSEFGEHPGVAMVPGVRNGDPDAYCMRCWKCHGPHSIVGNRFDAVRCCLPAAAEKPTPVQERCRHCGSVKGTRTQCKFVTLDGREPCEFDTGGNDGQ